MECFLPASIHDVFAEGKKEQEGCKGAGLCTKYRNKGPQIFVTCAFLQDPSWFPGLHFVILT